MRFSWYPVYRHIKKDGSLQRIELRDLRDKQIFADLFQLEKHK
jgi:hypothetical protein